MHFDASHIVNILLVLAYAASVVVGIIIISQNRNPTKTIAYLLLFFALPYIGILIYFTLGENYRKNKLYKRKYLSDNEKVKRYESKMIRHSNEMLQREVRSLNGNEQIIRLLMNDAQLPLTIENDVAILNNGEEKFEAVFEALKQAKHHIHIEYYVIEKGVIADKLKNILIRKVKEGVEVRIIYDDVGTSLPRKYLKELNQAGVKLFPFYKIIFPLLSNRHNYRDHRKIIIIDGSIGFTGGINISDRYDNKINKNEFYWRDMHLKICGDAVKQLQYLFFLNWNFCSDEELPVNDCYFPPHIKEGNQMMQLAYSGPDSNRASIMLSYFAAICNAQQCVYITTPYFIPNESIMNALKKAALSKVDVRLLVPDFSDAVVVNYAAHSYYEELLDCGVKIYLYKKGFIHSKTMVVDDCLSMVGSANMDIRSFDLNFELNAIVYDNKVHAALKKAFMEDLENSEEIFYQNWKQRGRIKRFAESFARLFSSVM